MKQINERQESRTANTGFASGGVTFKIGDLFVYSSLVLVDSFLLRNPPERKARKRWRPLIGQISRQCCKINIYEKLTF